MASPSFWRRRQIFTVKQIFIKCGQRINMWSVSDLFHLVRQYFCLILGLIFGIWEFILRISSVFTCRLKVFLILRRASRLTGQTAVWNKVVLIYLACRVEKKQLETACRSTEVKRKIHHRAVMAKGETWTSWSAVATSWKARGGRRGTRGDSLSQFDLRRITRGPAPPLLKWFSKAEERGRNREIPH